MNAKIILEKLQSSINQEKKQIFEQSVPSVYFKTFDAIYRILPPPPVFLFPQFQISCCDIILGYTL